MEQEIIKDLIKTHKKDIVILDGLLQWALNPTSMSASYGIDDNYPYIAENLKITHGLTQSEADSTIENLKSECEKFLEYKKDKYDIDNYRNIIINELSKPDYYELVENFFLKKKKRAGENVIRFLNIYKNCPVKNYTCLNVQYNAIYGEELQEDEIIQLGILKPLYWISSGKSRNTEVIPKYIPFLDLIMDKVKLKKWKPVQPDVKDFLNNLKINHDLNTINFLKDLLRRNELYTLISVEDLKVTPQKGFLGIFKPSDRRYVYAGISFLIQDELLYLLKELMTEELKESTEKIIKILEYEIENGKQPSDKEIVRLFDININEIENYEIYINELPAESFLDDQEIIKKASQAIKQFENPSLFDLLKTLQYDIETARKVGKYLIEKGMINELSRVPKEISSSTPLRASVQPSRLENIICNACKSPLTDRENPQFCPYCGSSDLILK